MLQVAIYFTKVSSLRKYTVKSDWQSNYHYHDILGLKLYTTNDTHKGTFNRQQIISIKWATTLPNINSFLSWIYFYDWDDKTP